MFLSEPSPTPEVEALYDEDRVDAGYVDNLTRLWAHRPEVVTSFFATRGLLVDGSSLSTTDVTVLNAAAAAARRNSYCGLAWGSKLARETDPATAALVLGGADPADQRLAALAAWARQVVVAPASATPSDVERLRACGLDDREILEATVVVALRLAFSTVSDALGAEPDLQLAESAPPEVRAAVGYGRPPSAVPSEG